MYSQKQKSSKNTFSDLYSVYLCNSKTNKKKTKGKSYNLNNVIPDNSNDFSKHLISITILCGVNLVMS